MWPVSDRYLDAVRYPHTRVTTATHRNLITGVETDLPILDGSVTVDSTASIRRTLALTLPATQALFDLLDTPGGEITVTSTLRFVAHDSETVPLGVFIVDQTQLGYAPGSTLTLTCPDRWLKIQRNRFAAARSSVPTNAAWQEIQRLVEACWPSSTFPFPGWSLLDKSATTKVGSLLWDDGDREAAVNGIAQSNSMEVFFDAAGLAVLRPVPVLTDTSPPVWTIGAGVNGVLVAADRTRDMSRTRNSVLVSPAATDVIFAPVLVANTTVGDPYNTTGPLGVVPYEWSSPTLRNSAQAVLAAKTMLSRQLGVAKTLNLSAVPNCALDAEDVIEVLLPQIDRNTPRPSELHILDSLTIPLTPEGGQDAQTRSTRPDTDGT
jgi:hypothetical protein